MLFKNITVLDENYQIKNNMYVATDGRTISYVGKERPAGDTGREYDGRGRLRDSTIHTLIRLWL